MALDHYSTEDRAILKQALVKECYREGGAQCSINNIIVRKDNGYLEAKVDDWFYAKVDPEAVIAAHKALPEESTGKSACIPASDLTPATMINAAEVEASMEQALEDERLHATVSIGPISVEHDLINGQEIPVCDNSEAKVAETSSVAEPIASVVSMEAPEKETPATEQTPEEIQKMTEFADDRYRHHMTNIQSEMDVLNGLRNSTAFNELPVEKQTALNERMNVLAQQRSELFEVVDKPVAEQTTFFMVKDTQIPLEIAEKSAFEAVMSNETVATSDNRSWYQRWGSAACEGVSSAASYVADTAGNVYEGATELATDAYEGAATLASNAYEGAKEFASDTYEGAKELASDMVEGAVALGTDIKEAANYTVTYVADTAGSAYNGTVQYVSGAVQAGDEWLQNTLKVDADDNSFVAGLKRDVAAGIAFTKGTGEFLYETVEGVVVLGAGTIKTVGTGWVAIADTVSGGYLNQNFEFVRDAHAHNASVSTMVTNIVQSAKPVVVDYGISVGSIVYDGTLDVVSYGANAVGADEFAKDVDGVNRIRDSHMGNEAIYNTTRRVRAATDYLGKYGAEGYEAYRTGDYHRLAERVKHAEMVVTTVVAPEIILAKAGIIGRSANAAGKLGRAEDVASGARAVIQTEKTLDRAEDVASTLNRADDVAHSAEAISNASRITNKVDDVTIFENHVKKTIELNAETASKLSQQAIPKNINPSHLDELVTQGIKHTPEEIIRIDKLSNEKIVFLEKGNSAAGFEHILARHGQQFIDKGIPLEKIPDVIMETLRNGKIIGYQGKSQGRPIYEAVINGKKYELAITTGNNGFIVGANFRGAIK